MSVEQTAPPRALRPAERIAVAVDVADRVRLLELVQALKGEVGLFKLGKEVFTALGPAAVELVRAEGAQVFLDLKYHDIPNTVAGAVHAAGRLGVRMLTVHASGGEAMLRAAHEAAQAAAVPPLVIAVTVLTSLADADLERLGLAGPVAQAVERLARLALGAGADGLVASAQEVGRLRRGLGTAPWLITPGIRPAGAGHQDQARVATPGQAAADGADVLVVGRPITQAPDPVAAARAIAAELGGGAP
ncbi:MAG TPA: orotidine-5'-phosphate decarboxylase [Myxococcota bacterium]|nr:orotidine-5'-phosphate decarboxylase [Myxococcota bacterium]HRY94412.1 orotidine-5'-phosphate decarboxylase [Myxococcota bacterium]